MIGGVDIEIPTLAGRSSLDYCVRAILRFWPRPLFEDGDTGERFSEFRQLPVGNLRELLVYRDAETAAKWDALGAVPELQDTMVHLLSDEGYVTIVVDNPESDEMSRLLETLRTGLRLDIFAIPAQVGLAA